MITEREWRLLRRTIAKFRAKRRRDFAKWGIGYYVAQAEAMTAVLGDMDRIGRAALQRQGKAKEKR